MVSSGGRIDKNGTSEKEITDDLSLEFTMPEPTEEDLEWAEERRRKTFFKGIEWQMATALREGNIWRAQFLLENYPKKLDFSKSFAEYDHRIYLNHAIAGKNEQSVKFALKQYSKFEETSRIRDLLDDAARSTPNIVKLVTRELEDFDSKRVFQTAISNGYENIVLAMLEEGWDVNDPDISLLSMSIQEDKLNVVKTLINAGADIETDSEMLVLEAERLGHHAVAKYLERQIALLRPVTTEVDWEKISDQEIIYTRVSENNIYTITDLFNYADRTVTRTQYKNDQSLPPAAHVFDFGAPNNDKTLLSEAFNQLVEKGGNPNPIKSVVKAAPLSLKRSG